MNLSFKIYFEKMLQYKTSVRWVVEKLIPGIKLEIRPYHQNECELKWTRVWHYHGSDTPTFPRANFLYFFAHDCNQSWIKGVLVLQNFCLLGRLGSHEERFFFVLMGKKCVFFQQILNCSIHKNQKLVYLKFFWTPFCILQGEVVYLKA